MSSTSTYEVKFKRRLKGKTNYRKRLAFLKSGMPRAVIRRSNNSIQVQVINYGKNGDVTLASASSGELRKLGWKHHGGNLSAAYLTGMLCGTRAKGNGIARAIVDIGMISPVHGSGIFAAAKGIADSGIELPLDASAVPSEDRIKGKHLKDGAPAEFEKIIQEIRKK